MGWETRERGGRYYYQKERIGSRVVSRYLGSGIIAQGYSILAEQERTERETKRAKERKAREREQEADAAFDAIAQLVETVAAAYLLVAGFHEHKRQWRLIRGGKEDKP